LQLDLRNFAQLKQGPKGTPNLLTDRNLTLHQVKFQKEGEEGQENMTKNLSKKQSVQSQDKGQIEQVKTDDDYNEGN